MKKKKLTALQIVNAALRRMTPWNFVTAASGGAPTTAGAEPAAVRFVNQMQITDKHGKVIDAWRDSCGGHVELYNAMACQDGCMAMIRGETPAQDLGGLLAQQVYAHHLHHGHTFHPRIVKRITNDEVIDA